MTPGPWRRSALTLCNMYISKWWCQVLNLYEQRKVLIKCSYIPCSPLQFYTNMRSVINLFIEQNGKLFHFQNQSFRSWGKMYIYSALIFFFPSKTVNLVTLLIFPCQKKYLLNCIKSESESSALKPYFKTHWGIKAFCRVSTSLSPRTHQLEPAFQNICLAINSVIRRRKTALYLMQNSKTQHIWVLFITLHYSLIILL